MDRRKRAVSTKAEGSISHAACAVCGEKDDRKLAVVQLRGGTDATLCGSHALMHARSKADIRTLADLKIAFAERRETSRRLDRSGGDELAERLQSAFTRERRVG